MGGGNSAMLWKLLFYIGGVCGIILWCSDIVLIEENRKEDEYMSKVWKVIGIECLVLLGCVGCAKENGKGEVSDSPKSTDVAIVTEAPVTEGPVKERDAVEIRIASLKGPTTMGMVKLMRDSDDKATKDTYSVTMHGTADEIVAGIVKGSIDVACVPCNVASVLYAKTEQKIQVAAINTLGVLYIVETGNTIQSVADLKGKTIYSTGKGTTPEYVLNYLLKSNGIDPENDVTIEYKSEATEVASVLATEKDAIAMLPEPFVTTASTKNENLRVAIDVTKEWEKVNASNGTTCVTGVVIARKEFIEANPEAMKDFLANYQTSTEWVNKNVDQAAALVGAYDIVPEAVAKKAISKCNITYIAGEDMQKKVSSYLNVLYEQNPSSVGGKIPDEGFYYK